MWQKIIASSLVVLTINVWAGTLDHLMWVGKQDALILGEIIATDKSGLDQIRILDVLPQTKDVLTAGQVIQLKQSATSSTAAPQLGHKYFFSLKRQNEVYQVAWGALELIPASTNLRDARLLDPNLVSEQYLLSTGGKERLALYQYNNQVDHTVKDTQIPAEVLKQMSTRVLIEHWINYPHLTLLSAFNSLQQGFESLRSFNGLEALLKRSDTVQVLLKTLQEKDLSVFSHPLSGNEQVFFQNEQVALSLLMAQPELIKQLTQEESTQLGTEVDLRLQQINNNQALANSNLKAAYKLLKQNLTK